MSRRDVAKRRRERGQDRVCGVCGANAGIEGALPFGWDTADVRPFVRTCSEACRETGKWREYEAKKRELRDAGLGPEEYEKRIADVVKELGI